jgi:hypothetical protein
MRLFEMNPVFPKRPKEVLLKQELAAKKRI